MIYALITLLNKIVMETVVVQLLLMNVDNVLSLIAMKIRLVFKETVIVMVMVKMIGQLQVNV